jgi:hypothetical protein
MGIVSPELGLRLSDHTWNLRMTGGGDLLLYQQHPSPVWNTRGALQLHARPSERVAIESRVNATYAVDPIGLAQLGIFDTRGRGFIGSASFRGAWRLDPDWTVAGTFSELLVRFYDSTGSAAHTPGLEATRRVGHRLEVGGAYRFDFFQGLGPGAQNAYAHEAQAVLRYRWARHLALEAQLGPAFWRGSAGDTAVLPQALVAIVTEFRHGGGARLSVRHGVGLGLLATPGLFDAIEGGITTRVARRFQLHADGGIWRSGDIPWGANAVLGYGIQGSFDYRVGNGVLMGIAGSRFARLDHPAPQYDRNVVGLHVAWELQHRGEP